MMKAEIIIERADGDARYAVEIEGDRTVLDALEKLRSTREPGLAYRHSCHHGSCGTCGAMIDGKPRLMCLAKMREFEGRPVRLAPLAGMAVLDGIAVHPGKFFSSLPRTSYLRSEDSGTTPLPAAEPENFFYFDIPQAESLPLRLEDCIECGLCSAACPAKGDFAGPAALSAAEIEAEKNPKARMAMIRFAATPDGARACERKFQCDRACPQGLRPGGRITDLLRRLEKEG